MAAVTRGRPRSKTTKSADIACARKVLRSLHNAHALRENPLTGRFFSASQTEDQNDPALRVRGIVLEAIESLKARPGGPKALHAGRQHAILTRYDLQHESRESVARDLGIASSKFYYERRAALATLATHLKGYRLAPGQHFTEDRLSVQLQCAVALKEVGRADLSVALLKNLAGDAPAGTQRTGVLCNLVESFCDAADIKGATESLKLARDSMAEAPVPTAQAPILRARIDFASTQIAWLTGRTKEAVDTGERAIRLLRSAHFSGDPAPPELLASLLSFTGDILTNAGAVDKGIDHFNDGLRTLSAGGNSACTPLHTTILANLAFAQAISPGKMGRARRTNAEALELATHHRMLRSAAQTHANEAQFQYWRGSLRPALMHSRIAQSISSALCHPVERTRVAILHARLEAFCGDERAALVRLRNARRELPHNSYLWVLSQIIESEILAHSHAFSGALRAADVAAERAEKISSERGRGMAALVRAQAYEALGERTKAIEAVQTAIPALERSRGLFPLAKAFECSARLTNSARHRANAADLMLSFRQ